MTETPPFVARGTAIADGAGEGRIVRDIARRAPDRGLLRRARLTAPFRILSPQRFDARAPMAHLRHVSAFHYIATGGGTMITATGPAPRGRRGRPRPAAVRRPARLRGRSSGPGRNRQHVGHDLPRPRRGHLASEPRSAAAAGRHALLMRLVKSAEMMFSPLFRALPELLVEPADDASVGASLDRHGHRSGAAHGQDRSGQRGDPQPHHGAAVPRDPAPLCRPPARGQQGIARRSGRSGRGPRAQADPRRAGATLDNSIPWRGKPARRVRCWGSASMR